MWISLTAEPDMIFEEEPIAYCDRCGEPIYDYDVTDEEMIDAWMHGYLCKECKEEIEFYEEDI